MADGVYNTDRIIEQLKQDIIPWCPCANFVIFYKFKDEDGHWNFKHDLIEAKDKDEARRIFKLNHPDIRRFKVAGSIYIGF